MKMSKILAGVFIFTSMTTVAHAESAKCIVGEKSRGTLCVVSVDEHGQQALVRQPRMAFGSRKMVIYGDKAGALYVCKSLGYANVDDFQTILSKGLRPSPDFISFGVNGVSTIYPADPTHTWDFLENVVCRKN